MRTVPKGAKGWVPGADLGTGTLGLRRLFVRKLNCHLYYTFDEQEVVVRALWGARREHGPTI